MEVLDSPWFLLKHDGTTYGPVNFPQMKEWAAQAQISPLDKLSNDKTSWMRAPMLPGLEMDWLVELTADRLYGPTTLGALREFFLMGEIQGTTPVFNATDGTQFTCEGLIGTPEPEPQQEDATEIMVPSRSGIRVSLQQRIRELEAALLDERRAYDVLETRHAKLQQLYLQKTGEEPME